MKTSARHARSERGTALAAVLLASLTLASCGGDDDDGASETDSAPVSSLSSSTPEASDSAPANVVEAQRLVARFEATPTDVGITAPIDAEVPSGKTVFYISDGAETTIAQFEIVEEAAEILGWTAEILNTDGTPQQVQDAWAQILREQPDGVIASSFPRSMFNAELLEAEKLGIEVVGYDVPDEAGAGLDYMFTPTFGHFGEPMAAWVVANSDGAPNSVYVNLPDFPILTTIIDPFKEAMSRLAPEGSVDVLDMPLASIGTDAPNIIVSYLRAHPDVKHVVLSYDGMALGLPAALKAAGMDDIGIIGEAPSASNFQYIATGDQGATIATDLYVQNYAAIDALARLFAGVPIPGAPGGPPDYVSPIQLITVNNLPPLESIFPVVPDVKGHYSALWGK